MNMSIDAGKVAHDGMTWKEGSVLDQATLLVSKGKPLPWRGSLKGPYKKNYLLWKKVLTRIEIVGMPLEAGDVDVL